MRVVALLLTSLLLASCSDNGGSPSGSKTFTVASIASSEGYLVLQNLDDPNREHVLIEIGNGMMRECLYVPGRSQGEPRFCYRSAEIQSYGTTAARCVGGEYPDAQSNEVKLTFCESKDVEGDVVKIKPGTPYAHMVTLHRVAKYYSGAFYSIAFYAEKADAIAAIESTARTREAVGGSEQVANVQSKALTESSTHSAQDTQAASSEPDTSNSSAGVEFEPATIKHAPPPRYPPTALRAGISGTVGLSIDLDDQGRVTNVVVKDSSRNRDLDRAAMDAARKWQFYPARENGTAVAIKTIIPVTFGGNSDVATIDYVDEAAEDAGVDTEEASNTAAPAVARVKYQPTPSFSCTGSSLSDSEIAICSSNVLAALDAELAKAYSTKLKSADTESRSSILQSQRTWLARRDAECGGEVACLQSSLARRLAELQ